MKKVLFFSILLLSCSHPSLENRVNEYIKVMTALTHDKAMSKAAIKDFLDPAGNRDSLAEDYYNYWMRNDGQNSYSMKAKINSIEYKNETALVKIEDVWHMPDETYERFVSETEWIKKNGTWYRSATPGRLVERNAVDRP